MTRDSGITVPAALLRLLETVAEADDDPGSIMSIGHVDPDGFAAFVETLDGASR